jgi:predicted nucleic acid-binding protein
MSATAKLLMHGRSQMDKPPVDLDKFWAELDALGARDFLPDGIPDDPPVEPDPRVFFDEWSASIPTSSSGSWTDAVHRFATASENRCAEARLLERFLGLGVDVLPFDAEDAAHAGDIRGYLETKGTPIGPYDCLIAAQARRRGATLVTANVRQFARVPGLMVTDWVAWWMRRWRERTDGVRRRPGVLHPAGTRMRRACFSKLEKRDGRAASDSNGKRRSDCLGLSWAFGRTGNPKIASRFLLDTVELLVRRGERRRLLISNKAIDAYRRFHSAHKHLALVS